MFDSAALEEVTPVIVAVAMKSKSPNATLLSQHCPALVAPRYSTRAYHGCRNFSVIKVSLKHH